MKRPATVLELSKEEAEHLNYAHNDVVQVVMTTTGLMIFKKSCSMDDLEYDTMPASVDRMD